MFNLKDAYEEVTLDDVKAKVSDYEIWKYYCRNFEELDRSFLSELYNDNRPSCRIYRSNENILLYKDFGTGECYNCFTYIQKKYSCTFKEAIQIVANDFNITKTKLSINPKLIIGDENIQKKPIRNKTVIDIVPQGWTLKDYEYWSQYSIPFELLDEYNVFSVKHVFLHKNVNKPVIFNYTNNNPIYAYRFTSDGRYAYKIYMPFSEKKFRFLFNGTAEDIEGYYQLPLHNDILILTKSLKDCMCYRVLGYPAISLQGEANKLSYETFNKLLKRFNEIIVNYDNDEQGIKSTNSLVASFKFKHFYIDDAKDLSDYIKEYGITKAKELIDGKITERRNNKQTISEKFQGV